MSKQRGEVPAPSGEPVPAARKKNWIGRLSRAIGWLSAAMVAAGILLVLTPVGDWFGRDLAVIDDPPQEADYIVILGGNKERAVEAANLYRQGLAGKVIISSFPDDTEVLADVARRYGVSPRDIILDRHATRTADHPRTISQLAGVDYRGDRFIVVTSLYHTSRAKACFARFGYPRVQIHAPCWRLLDNAVPREREWKVRATELFPKAYEELAWAYYRVLGFL